MLSHLLYVCVLKRLPWKSYDIDLHYIPGDLRANVVEHFVPLPCHIALGQDESFTPNGREF